MNLKAIYEEGLKKYKDLGYKLINQTMCGYTSITLYYKEIEKKETCTIYDVVMFVYDFQKKKCGWKEEKNIRGNKNCTKTFDKFYIMQMNWNLN